MRGDLELLVVLPAGAAGRWMDRSLIAVRRGLRIGPRTQIADAYPVETREAAPRRITVHWRDEVPRVRTDTNRLREPGAGAPPVALADAGCRGKRGSDRANGMKKRLGWREWVVLPALGIRAVMAKVDTGARTSALHAVEVETYVRGGCDWVYFTLAQGPETDALVRVDMAVTDRRIIRDSGGHEQERPIIETLARVGDSEEEWPIEIALSRRDNMGFPMLLGRTAIRRRFIVDPGRSFMAGNPAEISRKQ